MNDTQHIIDPTKDPLMQIITIYGKHYVTTQQVHADYLRNATERGEKPRYRRHENFNRKVHTMPNKSKHIEQKDLLVLHWKDVKANKDVLTPILSQCFLATEHKPITFLTPTAQLELSHHLDDELNQEIAYRHSSGNPYAPGFLLTDKRQSRTREYDVEVEEGVWIKVRLRLPIRAWEIASAIRGVSLLCDNSNHPRLHGKHIHDDMYPWIADAVRETIRERKQTGAAGGSPHDTYAQHLGPQFWYPATQRMLGKLELAYALAMQKVHEKQLPPSRQVSYYKSILATEVAIAGLNIALPSAQKDITLFANGAYELHDKAQLPLFE